MKCRIILFLLFFSFIEILAHSQPASFKSKHIYNSFLYQEGLPNLIITDIDQDEKGYLWIGTDNGLSKFDGRFFKNYTDHWDTPCVLKDDGITDLVCQSDHHIYIGSIDGWYDFDQEKECFFHHIIKDNKGLAYKNQLIRKLLPIDSRNILIYTKYDIRICNKKNDQCESIFDLPINSSIVEDISDLVLLSKPSCIDKGFAYIYFNKQLATLNLQTFQINVIHKKLPTSELPQFLIAFDNSDVYLGGLYGFSYYWNHLKQQWVYLPLLNNGKKEEEFDLYNFIQSDNEYTICTNKSLATFQKNDNSFWQLNLFETDSELPIKKWANTNSLFQTMEGTIYLGTSHGLLAFQRSSSINGIINLAEIGLVSESLNTYKSVRIYTIKEGETIVIKDLGTNECYLLSMNVNSSQYLKLVAKIFDGSEYINAVIPYNKEHLLICGEDNIYIYNTKNKTNTFFQHSFIDSLKSHSFDRVDYLYLAPNRFIAGDGHQIYLYDKGSITGSSLLPFINEKRINFKQICKSAEAYPLLAMQDSVYFFDQKLKSQKVFSYDIKPASGVIQSLFRQKDELILSTKEAGIYWYKLEYEQFVLQEHFIDKNQITDRLIYNISLDKTKNGLWVATGSGFTHINLINKTVQHFGEKEGLKTLYFYQKPIAIDSTHAILYDGAHLFKATLNVDLENNKAPVFKSIHTTQNNILVENTNAETLIKQEERPFSIELSYVDHTNNKNTAFLQYQIQGDKNWTNLEYGNKIVLPYLPTGEMILKSRVAYRNGQYSSISQIKLNVVPALIKRPLFIAAMISLFVAAIVFFISNKIKAKRKAQREEEIANRLVAESELKALRTQMNPHFMFNSLNSIRNYILEHEPELAADYLSNFAYLIRLILQHSRSSLISLKEELEALDLYIDLEKMRFNNKFEFRKKIDPALDLEELMIPPLIVQPFIENAIWHGLLHKEHNRILKLIITQSENNFQVIIEDNGIGRKASSEINSKKYKSHKSLGLDITKERIRIICKQYEKDIQLSIIDLYNKNGQTNGTQIKLTLPIEII